MAVRQTDLKAILAFSTISQLGMIIAMLGFGTEVAIFAAMFHILNHATFKGSLFMIAGTIDHQTGTRNIRKLGGLLTFLPVTATLAIFATFSMAGIPLPFLNGFYSKELFFESTLLLDSSVNSFVSILSQAIPYLAVLGSIFTFVYSMYFYFGVFGGKKGNNQLEKQPKESTFGLLISSYILVAGAIIIGLFPQLVNGTLLTHAAQAVNDKVIVSNISFWHGLSTPFIMTLIVIGAGTLLFLTRKSWRKVYNILPGKLSGNKIYNRFIYSLDNHSTKVTNFYMNGSLRTYLAIIVSTIVIVTFTFMVLTDGLTVDLTNLADITFIEMAIVSIMTLAAFGTLFTRHNLTAILVLGVVGYGAAMLFVLYRAPDLALTQLVIETVTVALFLLCFYHLPNLKPRTESMRTKTLHIIIAGSFGLLMTLIGISAHSTNWFEKISDYFIETSLTEAGGRNIVNVILVDMRGVDTLFEITVLGIAALAIFALIKLKKSKETK